MVSDFACAQFRRDEHYRGPANAFGFGMRRCLSLPAVAGENFRNYAPIFPEK
jgi:hypothetical protein